MPPATITLPPMLTSGSDVAFRETIYSDVSGVRPPANLPRGVRPSDVAHRAAVHRADRHRLPARQRRRVDPRACGPHPAGRDARDDRGRAADRQGSVHQIGQHARSPKRAGAAVAGGEAAIRAINPLLRRVNDLLFQDMSREDFAVVAKFLAPSRSTANTPWRRSAGHNRSAPVRTDGTANSANARLNWQSQTV